MVNLRVLKPSEIDIPEKEIQEFFEKNVDSLEEGLKYVGSYIPIGTGVIDILAIDEDNNPVIIECKKIGNFDQDALIQLMDYYSWFSIDENHIRYLFSIFESKGFNNVSREIRLIALVSEVSDRVKNACWALSPSIKLVTFSFSKSSNEDEIFIVPKIILDTSVGTKSFINPPKSEDDHFKTNPQMKPLYEKFKEAVLAIDNNIKINPSPQDYIGFAGKKNFCALHVKKNWLRLDLLLTAEEANNPSFAYSEKWGGWGYFHLENESQIEQALELIKKAYIKST